MNLAPLPALRGLLGRNHCARVLLGPLARRRAPRRRLGELLAAEDILLDARAGTKAGLLDLVGLHMERRHGLARESVRASLAHRERVGSTAIGAGAAIPHARVARLERICVAYLRLATPIAFDAPDGRPVDDVLVLLVPKQAADEHLRILAEATELLADCGFRERLRDCTAAAQAQRLFARWSSPPR